MQKLIRTLLAGGMLAAVSSSLAWAQSSKPSAREKAGQTHRAGPKETVSPQRELDDTIAVLPWGYRNGKEAALQSAREVCSQLLSATGFHVLLIKSPLGAMPPARTKSGSKPETAPTLDSLLGKGRALLMQETGNGKDTPFELPTPETMREAGERLGVRYVLAGRAQWRSRYVWVGVSNRVKSICTVDVLILDRETGQLALTSRNVIGDSTEQKNPFSTVTNVIAMNPLPLVLPGSVTPQQQRAVIVAIAKALKPWIKTQRVRAALDQADESSAGAKPAFTSLLSPVRDLQAHLNIEIDDPKRLNGVDPDLVRLYNLHDVDLKYKAPNRIRLSANSPKEGQETLTLNEEIRTFTLANHNRVSRQDLSDAPQRRFALMNLCGLLTSDPFDYLRARFVRNEPMNGVSTVVYDLTYWGAEEGVYHRVWIDPEARHLLKDEAYSRDNKLQSVILYRQSQQIAPNVRIPTRVEIQNAAKQPVLSIRIREAKINQGMAESAFLPQIPKKQ